MREHQLSATARTTQPIDGSNNCQYCVITSAVSAVIRLITRAFPYALVKQINQFAYGNTNRSERSQSDLIVSKK